jgi:hypothetical protein
MLGSKQNDAEKTSIEMDDNPSGPLMISDHDEG